MRAVRASDYHVKAILQRDTSGAVDSYKQYSESFTNICTVLIDVDGIKPGSREFAVGDQIMATSGWQVRFRYQSGNLAPRANDRLVLPDGQVWNIINVDNAEWRNIEWVCLCGQVNQPPGL